MSELNAGVKETVVMMTEARALLCEGLLLQALQDPHSAESTSCIRAELSAVAGRKIKETLVHKGLLTAAREYIG